MTNLQDKIDLLYLKEAYKLAIGSPDPSTQNAAIIVRDNSTFNFSSLNIISKGINDFPKGIKVNDERLKRPLKYSFIEHAERNAIYNAVRKGISTHGGIMYAPFFACEDCGRAIIQAGIKEIIGYAGPEKWKTEINNSDYGKREWDKSIKLSLKMFNEAGLSYRFVDGQIGDVEILFRGKIKRP